MAALLLLLALLPFRSDAQERRAAVTVDYIAGADVYIALGARDGLAEGDTLRAFAGPSGGHLGAFVARVVTVRRTVLSFVSERFTVSVGDTLWLGLLRPPPEPAGEAAGAGGRDSAQARQQVGARSAAAPDVVRPPQVDGQIALEVDALQTLLAAGEARRYTTPTLRFWALASDLPGGLRMSANLRASRRWSSLAAGQPGIAVRAYEANVEKTFQALPLRLQAGRFSTPLEPYGSYWDGLLARVGGERFGIGAAGGYLPRRADEGFSTEIPRASLFADYHARGTALRYDASLGLHALRPRATYADQTVASLSQRLRWRELLLSQSVQAEREADGSWQLSAFQVAAALPLTHGLLVRTAVSRFRPAELAGPSPLPSYRRDRSSVGVGWYTGWMSVNADATRTSRADGSTTTGYSASLFVPRTLAGFGVSGSASRSDNVIFRSSYVTGELSRRIGRVQTRVGIRSTHFQGLLAAERNTGADLTFSAPLRGRTQLLLRAESWWGDASGRRQRLFTSLSTGF